MKNKISLTATDMLTFSHGIMTIAHIPQYYKYKTHTPPHTPSCTCRYSLDLQHGILGMPDVNIDTLSLAVRSQLKRPI